jgi:putative OPT family oligopeptide transporter
VKGSAPASSPRNSGNGALREVTPRAVALGVVLALILAVANAYLGLYAGMTVSASIPAAVVSMALLRLLGGATVLENNVVQTIASAGEAVAAGAIFTFPALVILGMQKSLSYTYVTTLCAAGATMGSLLVVFLRQTYIVNEALPYPEGFACAEVLRAGAEQARIGSLLLGGALGAALKAVQETVGLIPRALAGALWVGAAPIAATLNLSGALLGVGYIVNVRIASLTLLGAVIAWLVAIPLEGVLHPELRALDAAGAATRLWSEQTRYLGVGAMIAGGISTLWRLRGGIAKALGRGLMAARAELPATERREERDLGARAVLTAVAACVPAIFVICVTLSGTIWLSLFLALVLAVVGFFATAVAGYLTGLVGASNNPISGVTIIVLTAIALVLKSFGVGAQAGPQLAIMTGAVVCVAAAMAGDSLHDLATGFHVGATPRSLELMVLLGALASSLAVAPILALLMQAYGIAGTPGATERALPAPQAFLMAKVTQGVFSGGIPWNTTALGALLGVLLAGLDSYLAGRNAKWRTPPMPVAIGLYLPFGLSAAIFLGSLSRLFVRGRESRSGLLAAAGLVAGESLMGVILAAVVTIGLKLRSS